MNLANDTKNQHYISQVEQRLNTANPNAEPKNQKIYSFSILDRENHSIIQKQECKIENNLCFDELFSFDIIDKKKRKNFEDYFGQYESGIESDTENLLIKIGSKNIDLKIDLKSEILNLFISKFINFIRNPFSVKKILNTFEYGLKFHPLNELFREDWEKIINNKTKHQEYLCKEFSISEQDYKKWLHIIFMFFSRFEDEETPSLLELLIKEIYENKNTQPSVCIFTYDDAFCLLSDRGYTIPIGDNRVTSFDLNLCSKAFIRYIFVLFYNVILMDYFV